VLGGIWEIASRALAWPPIDRDAVPVAAWVNGRDSGEGRHTGPSLARALLRPSVQPLRDLRHRRPGQER